MIVAFCGHRDYFKKSEEKKRVMDFLNQRIGEEKVEFFLGEYGGFDRFAFECCEEFKQTHPQARLVFVTPYLRFSNAEIDQINRKKFDQILYPELERVPLRFAILKRNQYMMEKADVVICFINHSWGGAYQTVLYAKKKGKEIFNLAEMEI